MIYIYMYRSSQSICSIDLYLRTHTTVCREVEGKYQIRAKWEASDTVEGCGRLFKYES